MTKKKKFFEGQGSRLLPRTISAYHCSPYNRKSVTSHNKKKSGKRAYWKPCKYRTTKEQIKKETERGKTKQKFFLEKKGRGAEMKGLLRRKRRIRREEKQ
jgi:hypothetical protein